MDSHLTHPLFWGSLAVALGLAFVATFPVNRWLISRGLGHALVHAFHGAAPQGASSQAPHAPVSHHARHQGH